MDNQVYEQMQTLPEGIVNNIYKFLGKHPLANLIQDFKDEFKVDTDFNIFDERFKTDERSDYPENYNLFAISYFSINSLGDDLFDWLPDPRGSRFDISPIYSADNDALFTIVKNNRKIITEIMFRSDVGRHIIYHHKLGQTYDESHYESDTEDDSDSESESEAESEEESDDELINKISHH